MWTLAKIAAAYRVDDQVAFRRWLREQGIALPIRHRLDVKRAVGAYRASGGR